MPVLRTPSQYLFELIKRNRLTEQIALKSLTSMGLEKFRLLFSFHPWDIDSVFVGGRCVYRNGDAAPLEPRLSQETARRIWGAMARR